MKFIRVATLLTFTAALCAAGPKVRAQIVINEIVEDEQDFETTDVNPDTREFIELYNSGNSAVNIGGWTLNYYMLTGGTGTPTPGAYFATADTIPNGTMLSPGDYWVVGATGVPNVDQVIDGGTPIDLFPNSTTAQGGTIFELWNGDRTDPTKSIVDAVAMDTYRNSELANANQAQLDQIAAGQTVGPNARGGWWGQVESDNAHPTDTVNYPNRPMSLGRYRDGLDHNLNGRDFAMLPVSPGATNNLAEVDVHAVPNVDAVALGTSLRTNYYGSFKLPRVIDPTSDTLTLGTSKVNPAPIPASPQGGKAIIAWDETGGGNAIYSNQYSNEFKLYAYLDPTPLNVTTNTSNQNESTVYGIAGSTDPLYGTPNPGNLLTGKPGTGGNLTSTSNGSTGLGWIFQRVTSRDAAGTNTTESKLFLVDFNDGGDSVPAKNDWQIIQTIDLSTSAAAWHILGIDYDPATGNVVAVYDGQTFNFTTTTGLVGNFNVGYREARALAGSPTKIRPPTFDLFVAPAGLAGDYDNNGKVDAADYVLWRNGGPLQNGGSTGPEGYTTWRANFGKTLGAGAGSAAAVPEPTAIALLVVGCLGVVTRRRTK